MYEAPASNTDELSDLNPFTNPEKLPEYRHFQHKTKWNLATSMNITLENLNKLKSRIQNKTRRMWSHANQTTQPKLFPWVARKQSSVSAGTLLNISD